MVNAQMITESYIRRLGSSDPPIAITAAEYEAIADARAKLRRVSALGNKLIMLLENYIEFERELYALSLRYAVYNHAEWGEFQDAIYTVNRRLLNLLASCRLYLDQGEHEISELFGPDSLAARAFKSARNYEFDNTVGYRMMEGLRNHLQHEDIAVHQLGFPNQRHDLDDGAVLVHGIEPSINTTALRQNMRLSARVRETLATLPELVCITPWAREYVDGLSRVNAALRSESDNSVNQWQSTLTSAMDRARAQLGDGTFLVGRVGGDDEEVQLFTDFLKQRERHERRTHLLGHLARSFVIGSPGVPFSPRVS
jgi:hypothetical protein